MLAQNFLSAVDLGCSEADRTAAIAVLGMLEREELTFTPDVTEALKGFSMGFWWLSDECGTVGCIGGWMEAMGADCAVGMTAYEWNDLFCPLDYEVTPEVYTLDRCARALRSKLTTGKADWS